MDSVITRLGEQWDAAAPMLQSKPFPYVLASLLVVLITFAWQSSSSSDVPELNARAFYDLMNIRGLMAFVYNAKQMLGDWFKKNPNKPVAIYGDTGRIIILPANMANEIRSDKRFHLRKQVEMLMHGRLPGFEVFRDDNENQLVKAVINKNLTKQLANVTEPLAEETSLALTDYFGEDKEWQELPFKDTILKLVARLSSRIFLGPELCRNEEWLHVTSEYTMIVFMAAVFLRLWPVRLRPIANLFLSGCRKSRAYIKKTRDAIQPVIQERKRLQAEAAGGKAPQFNDAISWFDEAAGGAPFDPQIVQLSLSMAAVHTTTDLLAQTMGDIVMHPEIIEPLRKEIVSVLREDGSLKMTSLNKMTLLDSCIKESQRLKPLSVASMGRIATERVVLSDGTVIPKGHSILVDSSMMWDPKVHPESPEKWDAYRFVRMREDPKKQSLAPLVATAPEHLAFGYGNNVCPGRFFAANEIKIALVFILLRYDLKLEEGQTPQVMNLGLTCMFDPKVKISVRRRQEEIAVQ